MKPFKYAAIAVFITLSSAAAYAGTGTGTSQISATPPALSVVEVQPYTMTLERLPGAAPTGGFSLKSWATYLAQNPEDTVQPGCLKVAGDMNKSVGITITNLSNPAAPGGATLTFSGTPKIDVRTSSIDCADAISQTATSVGVNAAPLTATTSSSGEIYIAWSYRQPATASSGFMQLSAWEEGIFSGTVDVTVDYQ
ncbi:MULTISPECIES: hypothetical protein [Gammaproteobacteria]|uniref:hypothetical protein n=1 Tax=Gammaproteobacteria TaxID=1236 RepID=UPI0011D366D3|nr:MULTISPECIES: hypothetical protein [Gammaproteobacteria]EGR1136745.1 hypothetical protein [Vibrio cholerae]MBO2593509.1 hypothetical protein [Shewanella algae]QEY53382.1 hypothetical protein FTX45_00385 [Leclercia adecarboxylata]TXZ00623.1 hypothetical protein FXE61_07340 [Vibrio cholerae]GHY06169.1 hypothetical protein VCSRO68_2519 [Vibrio cholerae]